jgi:hypothetical protein
MPLRNPYWVILANLAGYIDSDRMDYLPKEVALKRLVEIAGKDFGYNIQRWNEWLIATNRLGESEFQIRQ